MRVCQFRHSGTKGDSIMTFDKPLLITTPTGELISLRTAVRRANKERREREEANKQKDFAVQQACARP
jgi:hypothetical protein